MNYTTYQFISLLIAIHISLFRPARYGYLSVFKSVHTDKLISLLIIRWLPLRKRQKRDYFAVKMYFGSMGEMSMNVFASEIMWLVTYSGNSFLQIKFVISLYLFTFAEKRAG